MTSQWANLQKGGGRQQGGTGRKEKGQRAMAAKGAANAEGSGSGLGVVDGGVS